MKTIHKFPLQLEDWQEIQMPQGAAILSIQTQMNSPCIWALVDTDSPLKARQFITRGTGHPIPEDWINYIGTYQLSGGHMVFHVLEVT